MFWRVWRFLCLCSVLFGFVFCVCARNWKCRLKSGRQQAYGPPIGTEVRAAVGPFRSTSSAISAKPRVRRVVPPPPKKMGVYCWTNVQAMSDDTGNERLWLDECIENVQPWSDGCIDDGMTMGGKMCTTTVVLFLVDNEGGIWFARCASRFACTLHRLPVLLRRVTRRT